MSEMSAYLEDGYTEEATIPGVAGLHPPCTFKFRPALPEERYEFQRIEDVSGAMRAKRTVKVIAQHVVAWDLMRRDKPADIKDEEGLKRLRPALLTKMLDYIMGYTPVQAGADAGN